MNKAKPLKIRSVNRATKYGVAAKSLEDLIKKGCNKLEVSRFGVQVCLYEDGTVVTEDYFQYLPDNSELVLVSEGETWHGFVYDVSQVLGLDRNTDQLIDAAKTLLSDERSPKRRKILGDYMRNLNDNSEMERREDDEDWFEGIIPRFKTKSAFMQNNCESRIRGYLREVTEHKKDIENANVKSQYSNVAKMLAKKLKADRYNGAYFNRSEEDVHRMCTTEGWFFCEGAFDVDVCTFDHLINPYMNRENRILFSTWNLDHVIEKKRTVIPTLVDALNRRERREINVDYFYKLLFTRKNLKLVHIVCHKKGIHELHCDSRKIYQQPR